MQSFRIRLRLRFRRFRRFRRLGLKAQSTSLGIGLPQGSFRARYQWSRRGTSAARGSLRFRLFCLFRRFRVSDPGDASPMDGGMSSNGCPSPGECWREPRWCPRAPLDPTPKTVKTGETDQRDKLGKEVQLVRSGCARTSPLRPCEHVEGPGGVHFVEQNAEGILVSCPRIAVAARDLAPGDTTNPFRADECGVASDHTET